MSKEPIEDGAATLVISLSGGRITATHPDGEVLLSADAPAGIWDKLVAVLVEDSLNQVGPMCHE